MPPKFRLLPPLIALTATTLLALGMAVYTRGLDANTWASMDLANAALENEYCEHNQMQALIRQPANSWSNLIYFFLGVWAICWGIQDYYQNKATPTFHFQLLTSHSTHPLRPFPAMTLWIAFTLIGLSFGSFYFHASLTRLGQHWDMAFTYALGLSLGCAAAYRLSLRPAKPHHTLAKIIWLTIAITSAILMYRFKWSINGRIALPAIMTLNFILLAVLYLRNRTRFHGWRLAIVVLTTALAAFFRSIDLAKTGCSPDAWLQYHACWHLCTGLAAFFYLAFLREEKG